MNIPKTPKGLSNKITKIRSELSAFKREYGFIDDGGGTRYYLFYLYFLLGDNRRSAQFMRWYENEFPDDVGDPFQLLCWALILHRISKGGDYQLASAMLSNIYLIPYLMGENLDRVDMWHSSNYEEPEFMDWIPERVQEAITEEDLTWIRVKHESELYRKILKRYIEIKHELQTTPVGEKRSALVQESYSLLDRL